MKDARAGKWLEGLKKYRLAALAALLGIVLMLLPGGNAEAEPTAGSPDAEAFDRGAVQDEMENILRAIDGVGELRLMLTVDSGTKRELAQDTTAERSGSEDMKRKSDGRRRYGQRHAGGRGDEPRLSALRRGARGLRGRRQRGRAPCRDAGGQRSDGAAERQDHRITGETMKIIIFGRKNMKKLWKRNMVAGAVLLLVCGAIFLNGRYAQQVEETDKILGQATLVDGAEGDAEEVSGEALPGDYFATARLTRQQARDSALSLLQEASGAAEVDEAAAAEAAQSIQTLAAYTLAEAQIENMITAKGYTDCVVFMADDGVSVVVSAGEDGLQTEDIAKITDIVKQETELTADCIKILEVN